MKNAPNQRRGTMKNVLRMSMIGLILAYTIDWTRSAQADLIDINCSGTVNQTWTPGLKLLPRMVSYNNTTQYTSCTSSDPDITAGSISFSGAFMNSCLANIGPTGEFTIEWSDGTTSTLELQGAGINVVGNVQIFTATGTVTSGRFVGDQAVMINTHVVTQLAACLTPAGLTQLSGSTSLVLTDIL
jgi:hypothetical protein